MIEPITIRRRLRPYNIELTDQQVRHVGTYLEKLLFWNQRINLTSIRDPAEIISRHFGESMFGASLLRDPCGSLVDIGSGAGFPGLALKLVCPGLRVFLVEPVTKKAVFLSEVVRALELTGVEILNKRIEETDAITVDVATMRAVGDFSSVLSHVSRLVPVGGQALLWLGSEDAASVSSIEDWQWDSRVKIPRSESTVILPGKRLPI